MSQEENLISFAPRQRYMVIHGFMGGRLSIPCSTDGSKDAVEFIKDLYQVPGVKEVFEKHGATFDTKMR